MGHFEPLLQFISAGREMCDFEHHVPAPYLRRTFFCARKPEKVALKVVGLGFYRLFVNAAERTRGLLAPYITNPDEILWVDAYDLTGDFNAGKNALGFLLGNGMQNGFGGEIWDFDTARFRSAPKLSMELIITYPGGAEEAFYADGQFRCAPSPILFDDLRSGERYDARREIPGWNRPDFDDSAWTPAVPAEAPRGALTPNRADPVVISRTLRPASFGPGRMARPADVREDVTPHPVPEDEQGTEGFLYDFGENVSGIPTLKIRNAAPGQKIILQFAERTFDGGLDLSTMPFLLNGYDHRAVYVCKGAPEEAYTPSFTYFGCQYCLVLGLREDQASEDLLSLGVIHTEFKRLADFSCSDDVLNRVYQAAIRSNLSNFVHFPTDCPHREKNGWTGDAAMSSEQFLLNHSCENNLSQWLTAICAAQDARGALPGIVPTGGWGFDWGNGPAWDFALVNIPYQIWQQRGDLEPARAAAGSIMRYLFYLHGKRDGQGLVHFGLGDWLPVTVIRAPLELTDTVMAIEISRRAAKMFKACGLSAEADYAARLHAEFRSAARENLIDFPTMTARGNSQTSQAMFLYSDVFDPAEKPAAFGRLLAIIEEDHNRFDCGMLGARVLFHVLSRFGRTDLAYAMITNPDAPSYGRMIASGSNTLWEMFDMAPKYSMNHHFFGDISSWMIRNLAGLNQNPRGTDADECLILPRFIDAVTRAEAHRTLPAGTLSCAYVRNGDKITCTLSVPRGAHGAFCLEPGWKFEDGTAYKPAETGTYVIVRAQ